MGQRKTNSSVTRTIVQKRKRETTYPSERATQHIVSSTTGTGWTVSDVDQTKYGEHLQDSESNFVRGAFFILAHQVRWQECVPDTKEDNG